VRPPHAGDDAIAVSPVDLRWRYHRYGLAFVWLDRRIRQSEHAAGSVSLGTYSLIGRNVSSGDDQRGVTLTAWEAFGPLRLSGTWLSGTTCSGYRTGTVTHTAASGRWMSVDYRRECIPAQRGPLRLDGASLLKQRRRVRVRAAGP
jgi:hypothetical protein